MIGFISDALEAIEGYIKDPDSFQSLLFNNHEDTNTAFDKLREDEANDSVGNSTATSAVSTPASNKKSATKRKSETKLKIKPVKVKENVETTPPIEEVKSPANKRKRVSSLNDKKSPIVDLVPNDTPRRKGEAAKALLNRPSSVIRPDTPEIDVAKVSSTLKSKNISPSNLTFGFLGLGVMGCGIVKNLINSGHKVVVWNRTASKVIDRFFY